MCFSTTTAYTHTYRHTHKHTHTRMHTRTHTHKYTHTHIHTYIITYPHSLKNMYAHDVMPVICWLLLTGGTWLWYKLAPTIVLLRVCHQFLYYILSERILLADDVLRYIFTKAIGLYSVYPDWGSLCQTSSRQRCLLNLSLLCEQATICNSITVETIENVMLP